MKSINERLLEELNYDPQSGDLVRIVRKSWGYQTVVLEMTGTDNHGYLATTMRHKGRIRRFFNHRIAWLFMTGVFPPKGMDIDHINGDKKDNRWTNLRLARRGQNNVNSGNPKNNTTGQKGVHPTRGRWFARIKVDQEIIHLGVFKDFEDAVNARKNAEKKYFGEFTKGDL